MDLPTLIIGCAATLFGAATLVLRLARPQFFKQYEAMKTRYGALAGSAIHVVGYSLLPLGFGVLCIFLALNGESILSR